MATLKDIADYAGISVSAASLAIRDHGKISIETKQRVWEAQEKLGYKINLLPRDNAIRAKAQGTTTRDIAFLLIDRSFDNPSYSSSFQTIADACFKKQWRPLYVTATLADLHKGKIPDLLRHQKVDGIIVSGVFNEPAYRTLSTTGIPLVALGNYDLGDEPWAACETDHELEIRIAVKRFKALGHTHLGLLNKGAIGRSSKQTIASFVSETAEQGITRTTVALQSTHRESHPEASDEEIELMAVRELISHRPTGIICAIHLAPVIYDVCDEVGLKIPTDVSVITKGADAKSYLIRPTLANITTYGNLSLAALRKLEQLIEDPNQVLTREVFAPRFIPGGSISKAPKR